MQVRDKRCLEFISTRTRPLAVTGDGVDFTVMRQIAERLRQRPARYGVSGEALVEQANGRFQTQVRKIQIKARQIRRHTQTFIDVHQIRQATDVEVFVGFETLFNAAAGDKQTALHIAWTPACRGVHKNLLNAWQRGEGDFTQHAFVSGDITPAHNRQGFALQFFFNDAACGSGEFRIFIQEEHPDSVVFC